MTLFEFNMIAMVISCVLLVGGYTANRSKLGGVAMGLWYLGTQFGPFAIAGYLPVACAVAGAALAAGANLLRRPGA